MNQTNSTGRARRVSVGTLGNKEIELLESQWNLLNEYVENAELQFNCGDREKALQFCKKALAIMPEYVPAMKLQLSIQKLQAGSENMPEVQLVDPGTQEDTEELETSTEISTDMSDTSSDTTVHQPFLIPGPVTSTPKPKSVQFSKIASTQNKGILKRSTSADNVRSSSGVQLEPPRTRQTSRKYSADQKIRREKVYDMLFNASSNKEDPRTLYMELAILWDAESQTFPCVARSCGVHEKNRIDICHHIIEEHLPPDTKPFFCKSCKVGFQNINNLLAHACYTHPNARWYAALKEMIAQHPR